MSYQQPGGWQDQSWPTPNQPYSDPGYQGYPGYPQSAAPAPGYEYGYGYGGPVVAAPRTNGLAVASLVTSLCGIFLCGVPGVIGAIMGHVARKQVRERGEDGGGMALAGIIIGWLFFVGYIVTFGLLIALGVFVESTAPGPGYDQPGYPYPS